LSLNKFINQRLSLQVYTVVFSLRIIYNEPTWKVIIRESDEEYRKLQNYVNQFEHKLMLFDRFGEMMKSIEKFFKV